ncbi:MAG: ABC transporter ATP-binding protein [Ruminococcaceae bacterium]|nr:ABC transporter ATP-binding protein [Oscillospiraceae bacterium]
MTKTKQPKQPRKKPRWNLWQNTGFMLRTAFACKRWDAPFLSVLIAVFTVLISLAELYIAPEILARVENAAPLSELLATIGFFTGSLLLLNGLMRYAANATDIAYMYPRLYLMVQQTLKGMHTSYPNTESVAFEDFLSKSRAMVGNNNGAAEAFWRKATTLLASVLSFVLWSVLLSRVHPVLLAVIIVGAVGSMLANRKIMNVYYAHREAEAGAMKEMEYFRSREEDRKLGKDLRLFGLRDWIEDLYAAAAKVYAHHQSRQERHLLWLDIVELIVTFARQGVAYFFLITMAIRDGMPASEFLLYFTAASNFAGFVSKILAAYTDLSKFSVDISIFRESLEYPEPFKLGEGTPITDMSCRELRLRDVSFKYPGAEDYTLRHINLTIRPGEKLAIVGLNGAGKTTLVRILCGLYDPTEGEVLLDGEDIRQFDRRDYYKLFSAVFQNYSVMDATVADNVTMSVTGRDEARMMECIRLAGLEKLLEKLPNGADSNLGRSIHEDGTELSGGETQRLLLARALYKNGPFLILDEPTAALDPLAEHDIYTRYNDMCRDKSALFISHRLASTRFCDKILFMEHGQITQTGTHQELLARKGAYADLFEVQARYYQEGGVENV